MSAGSSYRALTLAFPVEGIAAASRDKQFILYRTKRYLVLIVCVTPLQTLVAKALLQARKVNSFKLLYLTWIDNEKHRHYFHQLAGSASESAYVHLNSRFPVNFTRVVMALRHIRMRGETTVACGSIDNFYIHYIIKKYRCHDILTFDDGTANINQRSVYYRGAMQSHLQLIMMRFMRREIDAQWIRARSIAHYTIYPGMDNIVDTHKLIAINLSDVLENKVTGNNSARKLRIFLGQPIVDLQNEELTRWYRCMVRDLAIDEYLPHPREYNLQDFNNIVNTPLIAEEYILRKMKEFEVVCVYAFYSTALLNIEARGIKKIVVTYPGTPKNIAELYPYFQKRGCDILNISNDCGDVI